MDHIRRATDNGVRYQGLGRWTGCAGTSNVALFQRQRTTFRLDAVIAPSKDKSWPATLYEPSSVVSTTASDVHPSPGKKAVTAKAASFRIIGSQT